MSLVNIIILAVVQGLAELLPVSSSAHVIAAATLLGLDPTTPPFVLLLVMLHTGTMFAVIVYFWRAWKRTFFHSQREFIRFSTKIIIATGVTGCLGLGLLKAIEWYQDPGYTRLESWKLQVGEHPSQAVTPQTRLIDLAAADFEAKDPAKPKLFREDQTLRLFVAAGKKPAAYRDCLIKVPVPGEKKKPDDPTKVWTMEDLAEFFKGACGIVEATPSRPDVDKPGVELIPSPAVKIKAAEQVDATLTFTAKNDLKPGQFVIISDMVPSGYNGLYEVESAGLDSFTCAAHKQVDQSSNDSGAIPGTRPTISAATSAPALQDSVLPAASALGTFRRNVVQIAITGNEGTHLKLVEGGFSQASTGVTRIDFEDVTRKSVEHLFKRLDLVADALAAAGLLILIAGAAIRFQKEPRKGITTADGIWVGLIQGLSLPFRGFSRSGVTISVALLRGITRKRAEEFSFALAVVLTPPVLAYEGYKFLQHHTQTSPALMHFRDFLPGLEGMAFSFLAGLVALKLLSKLLEKGQWWVFGIYCLAASGAMLYLHFSKLHGF